MMIELYEQFKIWHHNFTPHRSKANGVVEEANKNIKKIVQKMVVMYKNWHEVLPFALHRATPYSLVYGMEVVLPIKVEIPSLRVLVEAELDEVEWVQVHNDQLNLIEEKLAALSHGQLYQRQVKKEFDKKIYLCKFREGDLVLKKILLGKWAPNYEGLYVVQRAFSRGAMILTNMDGKDLAHPINMDAIKKSYP
ncbi:hypothetical protein CR513_55510, partial [Mucuna pruriens]